MAPDLRNTIFWNELWHVVDWSTWKVWCDEVATWPHDGKLRGDEMPTCLYCIACRVDVPPW